MAELNDMPKCLNGMRSINKILDAVGETNYTVLSVKCRDTDNGEGNHYLSEVNHFSILIKKGNEEKLLNFVLKDMGSGFIEYILEVKGLEKEVSMYLDILPRVNQLLEEKVTPDMIFQPDLKSIVLNDLSPYGYVLADRMSCLDFQHSKLALSTLAKYHAGTVKYFEMSPGKFATVSEETSYNGSEDNIPYYFSKKNIKSALNILKRIPEGHEFVESVQRFYDTFWVDITKAITTDHGFKVIAHGDFWTTNILFRYVDGFPADCKIIDFQLTRLCSPTYDLFQFITIAMNRSIIDNRLDELLNVYTRTLNETLTKLGSSQRLSRSDLDIALEKTKVFGILDALVLPEIAFCDPEKPLQLSGLKKSDFRQGFPRGDPYEKAYEHKAVQEHIIFLLQFFRRKGYL